jgi:hypothetical protein
MIISSENTITLLAEFCQAQLLAPCFRIDRFNLSRQMRALLHWCRWTLVGPNEKKKMMLIVATMFFRHPVAITYATQEP